MKNVLIVSRVDAIVTHDNMGKIYKNVLSPIVSNQPFIGGGIDSSPYSFTNNNRLEVTIVGNLSRLEL